MIERILRHLRLWERSGSRAPPAPHDRIVPDRETRHVPDLEHVPDRPDVDAVDDVHFEL